MDIYLQLRHPYEIRFSVSVISYWYLMQLCTLYGMAVKEILDTQFEESFKISFHNSTRLQYFQIIKIPYHVLVLTLS
jgi:hypothetical protein